MNKRMTLILIIIIIIIVNQFVKRLSKLPRGPRSIIKTDGYQITS